MENTNATETRQYETYEHPWYPGEFCAQYRPLNPKTGKPWQASREISHGAQLNNRFSSRSLAIEACRIEIQKSGKTGQIVNS